MKLPLQITFRNIPSSETVEEWIRAKAEKLQTFYGRPIACRVAVDLPHRHHLRGRPYHFRIEIALPGGEIIANRVPNLSARVRQTEQSVLTKRLELDREHKNLHLAIDDGFEATMRQLRDYARRQRGDVKKHSLRPARRNRYGTAGGES